MPRQATPQRPRRTTKRPGRPPISSRQVKDSRTRLLDAAAKSFADRGYRGATVSEIVERADLSKGTFYWNFSSKEELFLALIDERIDLPLREMIELLRTAPREADMAEEASRRLAAVLQEDREVTLIGQEYWALAARQPRIRARYARRQAELRDALAGALEARREELGGPEFATPSDEVAAAILALVGGLALSRAIDPVGIPDHVFGETLAIVYAGLTARAQSAG